MMESVSDILNHETRLPATLKKTKADLLKSINPTKKTPSSREANLILGVLDDCIHQMEKASLLPHLMNFSDAPFLCLGEEVESLLKNHQMLQEKFQDMVLGGNLDQRELTKSGKAIQDSFRKIVRVFQASPNIGKMLKEGETETQRLRDGLFELREVVLERLLISSEEEVECREVMLEISQCHSANKELIDKLDKEVDMAIKDKDAGIYTLSNKVQELRSQLHQMEESLEEFASRTQQDAEKQSQSDKKSSEGKQACIQQEVNQLGSQLKKVMTANREREEDLQKKKYKEETEIESLIQKYDGEMGEKQTELEKITGIYETDEAELRELEEHFAILDQEYSQIMEQREKAQKKREQEEAERQIEDQAAFVIQAYWRGFCVRKAMKTRAKPKKTKKGKGKKRK